MKQRKYTIVSFSLDDRAVEWLDEKAELMKLDRSAFLEQVIGEVSGITELKRPAFTIKRLGK